MSDVSDMYRRTPDTQIRPQAEKHSLSAGTIVAKPSNRIVAPICRASFTRPPGLSRMTDARLNPRTTVSNLSPSPASIGPRMRTNGTATPGRSNFSISAAPADLAIPRSIAATTASHLVLNITDTPMPRVSKPCLNYEHMTNHFPICHLNAGRGNHV